MSLPPTLKKAMTPFPYSVAPEAPLEQAIRLMEEHSVHHLPVVADHRIVGIITPYNIMTALMTGRHDANLLVSDCYVTDAYVVDFDEPMDKVLLTMAEKHIGSAIVTRHGILAGLFTAVDACRSFGEFLSDNFPHGDGNEAA